MIIFVKLQSYVHFDPAIEITLQCDASNDGRRYALLQGQPVVFGARGLTQAKNKYTQIEKEMLTHSLDV